MGLYDMLHQWYSFRYLNSKGIVMNQHDKELSDLADWILKEPAYTKADMMDKIQEYAQSQLQAFIQKLEGEAQPRVISDDGNGIQTIEGWFITLDVLKKYKEANNEKESN